MCFSKHRGCNNSEYIFHIRTESCTKFSKKILQKYNNGSYFFSEIYNEKIPIRKALLNIPKNKKIIGPSRATATIYRPGMTNLYTVEAFLKRDKIYDFLFYWKGQEFSFEGKRISKQEIMDRFCKADISKVIYNSDVFFLAEGAFDSECYERNYP